MTAPTAAGVDVRARVAEFHARHYSANLMRLAVYGKEVKGVGWGMKGGEPPSQSPRRCLLELQRTYGCFLTVEAVRAAESTRFQQNLPHLRSRASLKPPVVES
jgi:hypothetical protein